MNPKHQSLAQVSSIYEDATDCNSLTEIQTTTDVNDSTFLIVDSAEMKLFPFMSLAEKDDVAMLFIEKGEVTLEHDRETYILSKGMLLYKVPQATLRLLSFSEDCHFKVLSLVPQFAIASNVPTKHLETVTVIASNNPVFMLDTLTAASVTVLFWLLQKKVSWEEKAQSPDETIQHVFSILILEIISSYKRSIEDNPYRN
jgi:hypothetical protein